MRRVIQIDPDAWLWFVGGSWSDCGWSFRGPDKFTVGFPGEFGHLARQGMPEFSSVALGDESEKVLVVEGRVFPRLFRAFEIHIVGMDVDQRHAALVSDPFQLFFPRFRPAF